MRFLPEGKRVECDAGRTILDAARQASVDFLGPCSGRALCAKCVIRIISGGAISGPTPDEESVLSQTEVSEGYRLGCRCALVGDGETVVLIPNESRIGTSVLLAEGEIREEQLDPAVRKVRASLMPASRDPRQHGFNFLLADGRECSLDVGTVSDAGRLRELDSSGSLFVVMHREEPLDVRGECRVLGFAVDIGTTKIAGYLLDLSEGKTLSVVSEINPQIVCGEDVMSRLQYAIGGGEHQLQAKVSECINQLLRKACEAASVSVEDVYEFVAVGNTVMHHLFLGLDPRPLAYYPYLPKTTEQLSLDAARAGLQGNARAKLFLPPLIAGYVGSDVVADIVATGMHEDDGVSSILMDIGTNTEIVVGHRGRFLACSTASGPAFEGAHISFGMRAATGAIDRIEISEGGEPRFTVIGKTKPRGITGSGVVDAVAELFKAGLMEKSGRLSPEHASSRLRTNTSGYREYVVAFQDETAIGTDLTLSQKDIREIQLAKAAIRAGTNILMKEAGLDAGGVSVLKTAGAFGFFLNPTSAQAIGLYPMVEPTRIRLVGNTAVTGARGMLLSNKLRESAAQLAKRVEYVELASRPDFKSEFMKSISLP